MKMPEPDRVQAVNAMYFSSPDNSYEVLGRSSEFNSFEQTDGGTSSVEQREDANKSTRVLIPR
jgi:hypothetical protein